METVIKQWQEIQSDSIRIVDADGKTHNLIIAGSENAEQKTDYNSNSVEMSKDSNELAQERVHTSCDLKTPDKEQTQDLISQKRQVEKTQTENVELNTVKDINSQEIRTTTERKLTDSDQNPEVYPLPEPMEQGRPNGRKHKVRYHLWEFLRDILFNEKYCPEYIEWTDKSTGEFRLNDWNFVADLWGRAKSDRCLSMDYAKMSRAIRYYKKTNILTRVRRLTFRFSEEIMPQIKAPSTMHSLVIK